MADVREFLLPDLGEGLDEGEIVRWLVDVGDQVDLNQEIVEVETAKAVVAVPCPFAGTLKEKFGKPGETLRVGRPLCRIDVEAVARHVETADVGRHPTGRSIAQAATEGTPAAATSEAARYVEITSGLYGEVRETGLTGLDADEEPRPLVGYGQGKGGRRRRRGRGPSRAEAGSSNPRAASSPSKPRATPAVRKLAKDLGVDLATIALSSGPKEVITHEDVQAAAKGEHVRGIRKHIIETMEHSRRDIPHALCSRQADLTALWEVRRDLTAQAQADGFDVKITPFALICRATVLALRRFPTLNALYDRDADEIRLLDHINLGVTVDTDRGLVVPNIKDAHSKSTLQLAVETVELAEKCRRGTVTPKEMTAGTFTVDNHGYFGSDHGSPIINAPEVGILGVGAVREKPWVDKGEIAARRVCRFTLAFDPRVYDAGEAGRFVTYVANLCENPALILLHS